MFIIHNFVVSWTSFHGIGCNKFTDLLKISMYLFSLHIQQYVAEPTFFNEHF